MLEVLKIVALCVGAAIVYGILHDQVTARVCVEYFTVGHPPVFHTNDPTLLAFGWGIIASWWVGLFLGVPAALLARVGPPPRVDAARLLRPVAMLLIVMAAASLMAGIAGYLAAREGLAALPASLAARIPLSRHARFVADWWAHTAAYGTGFYGGTILWVWILFRRRRRSRAA